MRKLILLYFVLIMLTSCNNTTDHKIKIGFVAGFTGKYSTTSIKIRDGFMLAFNEINYKIHDKKIKIVQKDDKQDPAIAKKIAQYFIKNNIKLIIGNATSSMTNVTLNELKNKNDFLLASILASSNDFSNKDDNFVRTQVDDNSKQYTRLKSYFIKNNIKKVFYIYDNNNFNYTKGYFNFFQNILIDSGGEKFINSKPIHDGYKNIINKLKNSTFDMILIVASSSDTANLIQHIKLNQINNQIMISEWANTNDFIEFGGKVIEGVIVNSGYNQESQDSKYLEFKNRFKKFYKREASTYEAKGYEMAKIIIKNLKKTTDISKLKNLIINEKTYEGLQGKIIFNKYGDVYKEYFIMKLENGKFKRVP